MRLDSENTTLGPAFEPSKGLRQDHSDVVIPPYRLLEVQNKRKHYDTSKEDLQR